MFIVKPSNSIRYDSFTTPTLVCINPVCFIVHVSLNAFILVVLISSLGLKDLLLDIMCRKKLEN